MTKLLGNLSLVADLCSQDVDDAFKLMDRHYGNVTRPTFESDLAEKRWIVQLRSEASDELCGFSTQMLIDATVDERPVKVLFSGDTIIDPRYWGDSALMEVGGKLCLSLIDEFPNDELYWFLISAGYKTYRFLPVFFRQFYPRFNEPTPQRIQRVIDAFSMQKFPERYDGAGVVSSNAQQHRLRQGIADVTSERLQDPHVQFFVDRNPRYASGDELCCLARLNRDNFTRAAHRILGMKRRDASAESTAIDHCA